MGILDVLGMCVRVYVCMYVFAFSDRSQTSSGNPLCEMPPLIPATIWTRKDIREFKETVRKNPENVIRVGSLSTATVSHVTLFSGMWLSYNLGLIAIVQEFGLFL